MESNVHSTTNLPCSVPPIKVFSTQEAPESVSVLILLGSGEELKLVRGSLSSGSSREQADGKWQAEMGRDWPILQGVEPANLLSQEFIHELPVNS